LVRAFLVAETVKVAPYGAFDSFDLTAQRCSPFLAAFNGTRKARTPTQIPVHLMGHSRPVQIAMTHAASWACVWQHRGD